MKNLSILIFSLFIYTSCSNNEIQENVELKIEEDEYKYKLMLVDSYGFRRAYHGSETLKGEELDLFMNRNPEPNEDYTNSNIHPLFQKLSEVGIFQEGTLNIRELDTLPDQFNYQVSQNKFFNVNTRYLEDPEEVDVPSFELTFTDNNKAVLIDTLEFDWPADVIFIKTDLDKDGTEELLSIHKWYIINGDNFDLNVYKLKK